MKKTIIALAACTVSLGAVSADVEIPGVTWNDLYFGAMKAGQSGSNTITETQVLSTTNGNQQFTLTDAAGNATSYAAYSFSFTLDSLTSTGSQFLYSTSRTSSGADGNALIVSKVGDGYTIGLGGRSDSSPSLTTTTIAAVTGHEYRLTYYNGIMFLADWTDKSEGNVIVWKPTAAATSLSGGKAGNVGTYAGKSTFWSSGANTVTLGQVANLTGVDLTAEQHKDIAGVIPEPATATLSLLALAGLASRRRRK